MLLKNNNTVEKTQLQRFKSSQKVSQTCQNFSFRSIIFLTYTKPFAVQKCLMLLDLQNSLASQKSSFRTVSSFHWCLPIYLFNDISCYKQFCRVTSSIQNTTTQEKLQKP